jgi:glucose-1-phosphate cytidylyltransferase
VKCVILAGGYGTRIAEESALRPKPMIEIGEHPIIWHIMKQYTHHGVTDFIICLGYKGYVIKEYFANYFLHSSDVTFDLAKNATQYHASRQEPWKITLVDTGEATMTGGRLKRVRPFLDPGEPFCMTYGDGVSDIDIRGEIAFHRQHGGKATVACVKPPPRFGRVVMDGHKVIAFEEKPVGESGMINGGYFVLDPSVIDYIEDDATSFEQGPLQQLAHIGELSGWRHDGFWQPMDTLRDRQLLERLWASGKAPWKVW